MMSEPLLHPATKRTLDSFVARPPHAIILKGEQGIGKTAVVDWLASQLLGIDQRQLHTYPYLLRINSDSGKAISIEQIRQLEHLISLRIPSQQAISRLVIIEQADLMTTEAQNALLKTLEEPPADTVLLLTSSQPAVLLPTIRSRSQSVALLAPPTVVLEAALKDSGLTLPQVHRIMALSGGLPGLAFALSMDDQSHPLVTAVQTARNLLQQSAFDKLCQVDTLAKNREATQHLIHMLSHMAHAALLTGKGTKRWQRVLQAAFDAEAALTKGTQPKLVLTNLMLNL